MATKTLPHPVLVKGSVREGSGEGTKLGFPTADLAAAVTLPDGVYLATVELDGLKFGGLVFLGAAENSNEIERKLRVYILDFDKQIHNRELRLSIFEKIRETMEFKSEKALIAQLKEDEKIAKNYFSIYFR